MNKNEKYLLPEEQRLASEINYAIKGFLLKGIDAELIKDISGFNKNWILDSKIVSELAKQLEQSGKNAELNRNERDYFEDLVGRVQDQANIVANLDSINRIELREMDHAIANNGNNEKFAGLNNLENLRGYLKEMAPYLDYMKEVAAPKSADKNTRLDFALPVLHEIQNAKKRGIPEETILKGIEHLNEGRILTPDHFANTVNNLMDSPKELFSNEYFADLDPVILSAMMRVERDIQENPLAIPLTGAQVEIMSEANSPELVREIGLLLSKGHVRNTVAAAIIDNVNALSETRDVNIPHLTKTFAMVAEMNNMTAKEMMVLGDLMLNDKKADLGYYNVEAKAKEAKQMDLKSVSFWQPPKHENGKAKGFAVER